MEYFIFWAVIALPLREKCPNTEFFLVGIFPYSVQMRENTDHTKLLIWTLFMQGTSWTQDVNWTIYVRLI